jgi:hypothetical protein
MVLVAGDDVRPRPFSLPDKMGAFEVLSSTPAPREFTATLTVFDVGVSTVPAQTWVVDTPAGPRELHSPDIPVTIRSTLPADARDIRDIRGPLDFPRAWGWAIALLIGAGILATAWALYRRRCRSAALPSVPPRPPHETAWEELDALESLLTGPAKLYYSRLADILRAYLEGQFRLPALDRTTTEIAAALKTSSVPAAFRPDLRDALESADLAKFAKWDVPVENRLAHLERARAFVAATRPAPVPTEGAR